MDVVPKILVVDDHEANLLVMEAVLGSLKAKVITVRSGLSAVHLVKKNEIFFGAS